MHTDSTHKKLQKSLNKDLKNILAISQQIQSKPNAEIPNKINIKINVKSQIPTNNIKYLGIYLDNKLSRKVHIDVLPATNCLLLIVC